MKKLIILVCVLILVSGTVGGTKKQEEGVETKEQEDVGTFRGVVSWDVVNLADRTGAHDLVIDDKLALELANIIFKSVYGDDFIEKTTFKVYELEGRDMFLISRRPKGVKGAGGGYEVAVSKKDGAILKVWMSE